MKRILALVLLAACSTPIVQEARVNIPAGAHAVEGASPRRWNQQISFGPWRTASVNEGTTRSWVADVGILDVGRTDQAYRFTVGATNVECHTRELVVGRSGVFVQASLGTSPILVCGLERDTLRSVLALTRSGSGEPSLRGELRQIGGTTYDVRSLHRAIGTTIASGDPLGYEIVRGETAFAVVETINRGRVWINSDAPNREDLAAASAALLLFRDPDAGTVD